MTHDDQTPMPARFAAPAPAAEDAQETEEEQQAIEAAERDHHLDELCERFAHWSITRRFYGGPKPPKSLLGQLAKRTRPMRLPPDAECSPMHAGLHLALMAQPEGRMARRVFELHYLHRVPSVKNACIALGISRVHWYRLLKEFRREIYAAGMQIQAANEAQEQALPHTQARAMPQAAHECQRKNEYSSVTN